MLAAGAPGAGAGAPGAGADVARGTGDVSGPDVAKLDVSGAKFDVDVTGDSNGSGAGALPD